MTQSIVIQVGQCGNQIGSRFWDLALREHSQYNKHSLYDGPLSTFFRNVDTIKRQYREIPLGNGREKIHTLKARAVLVDMEEGVVNNLISSPLGDLFDSRQLMTDVSGSGNNWAVGHYMYGDKYKEKIFDIVRHETEKCDCLQSFFVFHSMGGGTGSGLGSRILSLLHDEYKHVYKFSVPVFPSVDDDVITSPYNSVLAMRLLSDISDCVLPFDNEALIDITKLTGASAKKDPLKKEKPFDRMNDIVAGLLLNLTSSARFEGTLNVDLNEIAMNMVPFPRMQYLLSSMAPLYMPKDVGMAIRKIDQMFAETFSKEFQLLKVQPRQHLYLACALLVRGRVSLSDIRRNIDKLNACISFPYWNEKGWKIGHCNTPPVDKPYSLLTLANNTSILVYFDKIREKFIKLYKRRAHLHHYLGVDGMEMGCFEESIESLLGVIEGYRKMETQGQIQPKGVPRVKIV
ncbi:hypothetical protein LOD99_2941 [Oopsacas minuta]|uniref:Tubulin epsilon chain n=1 Tax=Oopsacas minuta TaxID=111878 RepID=A0AAV7K016_9METZ|nr:hypothetical protein LOD99_2941 [Oopsacas minuta]